MIARFRRRSQVWSIPAAAFLVVVATVALTNAQTKEAPAQASLSPLVAEARAVVTEMAQGQFMRVTARFDTTMKAALTAADLQTAWDGVVKQVGVFQRQLAARTEQYGSFRIVYITCQFKDGPVDTKVVFDTQGRIAGLFLQPTPVPAAPPPAAQTQPAISKAQDSRPQDDRPGPAGGLLLSHVADASDDKLSYNDTGFAEVFECPGGAGTVVAVEVYCSRYGTPQPPVENFHVYILDQNRKMIRDVAVPYGQVSRMGMKWYTFPIPQVRVPRTFYVALFFNAHRTKGIYVGKDNSVKQSHSFIGTPKEGFVPVEGTHDWMIRVRLAEDRP